MLSTEAPEEIIVDNRMKRHVIVNCTGIRCLHGKFGLMMSNHKRYTNISSNIIKLIFLLKIIFT